MASSREFVDYVVDCLSEAGDVYARAMMGEYVMYYRDKVIGGIYDDRFLVKPVPSAVAMLPGASREIPYEGAKEMLLVEDTDNREAMRALLEAMYEELPKPRRLKRRRQEMGAV